MIKEIVTNYMERSNATYGEISGILAVDAISLDREMVITDKGFVSGGLTSEVLDKDVLASIQKNFRELEEIWKQKLNSIISDAFVFQFHPITATPLLCIYAPVLRAKRHKNMYLC